VIGADGLVIGRIFRATMAPAGTPWMWTVSYGEHEDRTPTHSYEPPREAARLRQELLGKLAGRGIGTGLVLTVANRRLGKRLGFRHGESPT
jgi:hypothetical protein